jgi:hypothetical protein
VRVGARLLPRHSPSGGPEPKLCGYVLPHQKCGDMQGGVGPETESDYRLFVTCGCGVEFKRWMTPEEADEDLLRSALLAFEN